MAGRRGQSATTSDDNIRRRQFVSMGDHNGKHGQCVSTDKYNDSLCEIMSANAVCTITDKNGWLEFSERLLLIMGELIFRVGRLLVRMVD